MPRRACLWLGLVLLQACASPSERLLRQGVEWGFSRQTLLGKGFQMEAFVNSEASLSPGVLHIYLEGDGKPWANFGQVAQDPTSRHALMLKLMRQDRSPALYLGRPCYNGHAQDPGCSPLLWTHRRYSPEVVEAMQAALQGFLRAHPQQGLVFLGHSGGGTLALLLAPRFPQTRAVLTVAGNADIDLWADYHGYSRLQGSSNPAQYLSSGVPEVHYLGADDGNIPASLFHPLLEKRPHAQVRRITGFDHECCWEALWPEILLNLP